MHRPAKTVVELLAILTFLAIGFALLVMYLPQSRVAARRFTCENNLRNIHLATTSYVGSFRQYPIGTQDTSSPIRSEPIGYHHNFYSGLLPFLEQPVLYEQIDFTRGVYAPENQPIGDAQIRVLFCPESFETLAKNATSFAGVSASIEVPISESGDGMFLLNRVITPNDVPDGLAYVLLVGEKSHDVSPALPWNSGTRSSLRTMGSALNASVPDSIDPLYVGGFSSNHPGGVNFLFANGEVRFFPDETDAQFLQQLASRQDQTVANEADAETSSETE